MNQFYCFKKMVLFCFQILIEVDHLQDISGPYIQIKGVDKEAVAAAGSMLKFDDTYTTKVIDFIAAFLL